MTADVVFLRYGRRGGGWVPSGAVDLDGPPCEECGRAVIGMNARRHAMCGPRCQWCGHPLDLIADPAQHARDHKR